MHYLESNPIWAIRSFSASLHDLCHCPGNDVNMFIGNAIVERNPHLDRLWMGAHDVVKDIG